MARSRTLRRTLLPAVLALLLTGCPGDLEPEGPAIVNGTDEDIFVYVVRDVGTSGGPTRVTPGQFDRVSGDPCIDADTVVISDVGPDEPPDDVLLRHDLKEQPLCDGERWVFDGRRFARDR